jgi:hypothetical protein
MKARHISQIIFVSAGVALIWWGVNWQTAIGVLCTAISITNHFPSKDDLNDGFR